MGTRKEPSIKWSEADIQLIVSWLSERNLNGDLSNLNSYQSGNKSDAAMKFLVTTGLAVTKPGVTKEKTRDKIGNMIALYKRWEDKAGKTGWGVNVKEHDQVTDSSSSLMTIREILISKCSYYYEFEEIMGTSPNVAPPCIAESGHPDRVTMDEPLEDTKAQNYELSLRSGQGAKDNLVDIPIDPSRLPSAQQNSVLLGLNSDNPYESQTSLAKAILPIDGDTTKDEDADLDLNISGDEFDCEFPSSQKIFSTQHSHSVFSPQTDTSQLNSPSTQRTPLASCSSNDALPSTQRTSLVSRSSHISSPKPVETISKGKRGPGKKNR